MAAKAKRDSVAATIRAFGQSDSAAAADILRGSPEAAQWTEWGLKELLGWPGVLALVIESEGKVNGFIIGRQVAEEAEILNLAVVQVKRRQGEGGAGRGTTLARSRSLPRRAGGHPRRGAGAPAHPEQGQEEPDHAESEVHGRAHDRPGIAAALQAHVQAGPQAEHRFRHLQSGDSHRRPHAGGQALPQLAADGAAAVERGGDLHDGRLRLDGRRAEGDRPHRGLLDRYLAARQLQGPGDALHHPRRGGARSIARPSSTPASRAGR